jgi:uncharacterized membrane protein YebE (DUF533 family)
MDLGKILESVLGNQTGGRGAGGFGGGAHTGNDLDRLSEGVGGRPSPGAGSSGGFGGGGGGLGDLLGGALGGGRGGSGGGGLEGLTRNFPGGLGGLAAGGGLLSVLLSGRKKGGLRDGGSLIRTGGLAILGTLAYKAYRDWQAQQAQNQTAGSAPIEPPPRGSGFALEEEKDQEGRELGVALVQAMISASKADGHLDANESMQIQDQIRELGLDAEEKSFLMDAIGGPADAAAIARLARSREQASELYVASRIAMGEPDTPEEKAYLDRLTALLDLPADLVVHLDQQIASAARQIA